MGLWKELSRVPNFFLKKVVEFLHANPVQYLATVGRDGKAKCRPFMFIGEQEGEIMVLHNIVRKILGQLKAAGLVEVVRGTGGAYITKPLSEITFLDIYRAVECIDNGELFHFHENPNTKCPVGRNIHFILDDKLKQVQDAMERELASITLEDVKKDTEKYIEK